MTLTELVTEYVAFRKSLGEDFDSAESLLKTFCRRIGSEIDVDEIHAARVQAFLDGPGPVTRYWRRKYDTLRGRYRYATSRGFVDHVPLPATVPKMPERFQPYIYTPDELQRLINPTAPEQVVSHAPWRIPVAALQDERVLTEVRAIQERRPMNLAKYRAQSNLVLPGVD